MAEKEQDKNVPSPAPFIFKGWLIGVSIGAPVGTGLGILLAKQYGASATIGPNGLMAVFIVAGVIAGSYYGCMTAYSNYRKKYHLGI